MTLAPRQLVLLVLLTLSWGVNWPVMKLGVTEYPPLAFRALSIWLGLPFVYLGARRMGHSLRIERRDWAEVTQLALTNMTVWHVMAIVCIQALSSGRAAILGYTMPIFSALWGRWLFGERLSARQALGVLGAAIGVMLLLWHEFGRMTGQPWAAMGMLAAAAVWALGTQQLRRSRLAVPTITLVWWMLILSAVVLTVLTVLFERELWHAPSTAAWAAIAFNAVAIFGFAQIAWMVLARTLPPAASTLSVMMIPVLGVVTGALWLGETLHWQDGAAVLLMGVAIGSVLWPARARPTAS